MKISMRHTCSFAALSLVLILLSACTSPGSSSTPATAEPTPMPTATIAQPTGPIEVTIYVDDAYKPYSYGEEGNAKGMYIDVLEAVFDRMDGYTVTLRPVPWPRGKQIMEDGQGFGLAPAFFHGHDWPYLYPYSLPFYTETIIAICDADTLAEPRPNWPDDYVGLSVGNVAGFDGWGGEDFYDLVEAGEITYDEAPSSSSNILKLGAGRTNCIMMEERAFEYEYQQLLTSGEYEPAYAELVKGAIIGTDPVYIGYSKPARLAGEYPFQDEFMQAFDSALYQMLKSGEVTAVMDAYQE